tara:strand:+ start:913 stop:1080 length:168 start_codon:yes stop_codon:yes gene_type:complete
MKSGPSTTSKNKFVFNRIMIGELFLWLWVFCISALYLFQFADFFEPILMILESLL